jgi:hypothetical protein
MAARNQHLSLRVDTVDEWNYDDDLWERAGGKFRIPNPPAAAEEGQTLSEGGGHEPPAGDDASRQPQAESNSEIRISDR